MYTFSKYLFVIPMLFLFNNAAVLAQAANNISTTQSTTSTFFSKERWNASYSNYMNGPTFSESTGGSINHYLSLKHKLLSGWAVSGVLQPNSNFGTDSPTTMGDPYLRIDYPTIYENKNGFSINGNLRYFAPISESSKKAKTNGAIAPVFQLAGKTGKFDLTYLLIPKFYLNTVADDGQKLASQGHWLGVGYNLSELVGLDLALYPTWYYSRGEAVVFNNIPAYPGITLNFRKDFTVSPYVEIPLLKADARTMSGGASLSYKFL